MARRSALLFLIYSAAFHICLLGMLDVVMNFYFVSLGHNPETIGVLQSLPRLAGFITSVPIGLLTNRIGTRRMMLLATFGCAFALFIQLIPELPMLALSRFMFGLCYGAIQIVNAPLMMELVGPEQRTRFFAVHNAISMISMAFGSLVGGYMPTLVAGVIQPFMSSGDVISVTGTLAYGGAILTSALLGILSALPLIFIRGSGSGQVRTAANSTRQTVSRVPWKMLAIISLPMIPFGFTGGLTFPFFNLFWRTQFDQPDQTVGTILSIGWLGMAIVPMLDGWLEHRFGRAGALGVTMTIAGIAFFGMGLLLPIVISVAFFVIAISFRNTMQPMFQPLILDALPVSLHNVVSSMSMVFWNIGWFVATLMGGVIQTRLGFGPMMHIVAAGVLLTGILIVVLFRRRAASLAQFTLAWNEPAIQSTQEAS